MGLTRRYRHMNWTATPDLEPDAPPTLHIFQCNGENEQGVLCGQQSAAGEDFEAARGWSFQHLQANPDHRSYSHVLSRPWRMIPEIEPDPEPIVPLSGPARG
ncbi:hypothetical protein F4556_002338 [Kitasatospora gansuensis]|uniref:DUF7848 domain-containing protein n=1 Tax=Kitasatospora gansuensis TaxID=258050 RepID=A0A7W7SAE0_9ACTN|nr:hypothetical protein [Kitasatospora gansuensis]MBB4946803.1 hypothetical protein [Kitasatospora gansuensis]